MLKNLSSITTNDNKNSNFKANIIKPKVDNSVFSIGGKFIPYSNPYVESFSLTHYTNIAAWTTFINSYHYFAWAGEKAKSDS